MSLINLPFTIATDLFDREAIISSTKSDIELKTPLIFALPSELNVPILIPLTTFEEINANSENELSNNTTPAGQLKDLHYHLPTTSSITATIQPSDVNISKEALSTLLRATLGIDVFNSIAFNNVDLPLNDFNQILSSLTRIKDNKYACYFLNFHIDITRMTYRDYRTNTSWVLKGFNVSNDEGWNSLQLELDFQEVITPIEDGGAIVRKVIEEILL